MSVDENKSKDQLILFDLDGTLVDSREDIATSINVGLLEISGATREKEEIVFLIGLPLVHMYERLLPESDKHRAEEASEIYRQYYYDHCAVHTRVFPGVIDCLSNLTNVRKAIATTKATYQAQRVAEELNIASYFDLIQGSDGLPHKPNPAVLNKVMEKLKVSADACWMIGDTSYDILAAKAAGVRTCAVTYGIGAPEDLAKLKPDLILDSLDELPLFLKEYAL